MTKPGRVTTSPTQVDRRWQAVKLSRRTAAFRRADELDAQSAQILQIASREKTTDGNEPYVRLLRELARACSFEAGTIRRSPDGFIDPRWPRYIDC